MNTNGRAPARRRRRVGSDSIIAACAALATVGALAGCSNDPVIAQDTGAAEEAGSIELQSVTVQAELTGATPDSSASAYGNANLEFTAVNTAGTGTDRLLGITSSAASAVTIDATADQLVIEPATSIAAGQPVENLDGGDDGTDQPFTVTLELTDGELAPGTSIPVTFEFERAGSLSVDAPFDVYEPGELSDTARPLPPEVTPAP
ncbi:hypothetical protein CH262_05590 [Rhodococcus sp. 05-2255-1e]|nr:MULTISPECIES: hypothetical protein [Rhodococcus]MBY4206191.1 hypothetical protein [Rhodococcus fascians]OZD57132.1 hypothetical protein CH252_03610 [Rhodococcus sp. 06-1477-1B]AMY53822.1 hypothetical protein A3L23_02485 [Rhodococcus fascians D188]OZD52180.1 hypothetical protein CH266_09855 [Rhodococcus sp. 06-1474-1B]OZD87973.1 hypothetical protein CH260_26740 [Rhodococcus sp. 05-2256-B2]